MPSGLWYALLAKDRIRLAPFRQPGSPAAIGGEATAAFPGSLGRGLAQYLSAMPGAHERAVVVAGDLLTATDLVARTDFDWCGKCGGCAIRRLTEFSCPNTGRLTDCMTSNGDSRQERSA